LQPKVSKTCAVCSTLLFQSVRFQATILADDQTASHNLPAAGRFFCGLWQTTCEPSAMRYRASDAFLNQYLELI
jgi:hypothetical protein